MIDKKDVNFLEKVPPQNLDAEKAVISAMIVDKDAIARALETIDVENFYSEAHQKIYVGIIHLFNKGIPVDLVTLNDYLISQGQIDEIGGASYLSEITRILASTANIEYYLNIIKEKAELRKLILSSIETVEDAYTAKDDVSDIVDRAEARIFQVADNRIKEGLTPIRTSLNKTMDYLEKIYKKKSAITGVSTGFVDLDKYTAGFQRSDLIIIAARPSVGKTALILNIAENIGIRNSNYVAIFSLEMSKEQLCQRFICSYAKIDSHKARTGTFAEGDFSKITDSASGIMKAKIYIDDSSRVNILEIKAKARRMKALYGNLDIIFIDYLQLLAPPPNQRSENRQTEIASISRSLKQLARELEVPVVAAAQLNRGVESRQDKRPLLSDLRDSGAIEQDADVIMFLHRDDYYDKENEEAQGEAELIIAKQRNGPTGVVKLRFRKEYTRFENYVSDGVVQAETY